VLDTSALEGGLPGPGDARLVVTPGVLRELERRGRIGALEPLVSGGAVEVLEPSGAELEAARSASASVGDVPRLSEVDLEVLAVALGLSSRGLRVYILTNDISIQNVAARLGIPSSGPAVGRRRPIRWIYYCPGCGRSFSSPPEDLLCPVCGTRLRRKPRGTAPLP
jgi:rRNA maturation endonuclease Nob1